MCKRLQRDVGKMNEAASYIVHNMHTFARKPRIPSYTLFTMFLTYQHFSRDSQQLSQGPVTLYLAGLDFRTLEVISNAQPLLPESQINESFQQRYLFFKVLEKAEYH